MSAWIRNECGLGGEQILCGDQQLYHVLMTSHAMLMIFFFIMPIVLSCVSNLYLPMWLGVPELAYPRINAISWQLLPLAYTMLMLSWQVDEGCGHGWVLAPPLASLQTHAGLAVDTFIVGLHIAGLSACGGAVNVLCTVLYARRARTGCFKDGGGSLAVTAILAASLLVIFVIPILAAVITMILLDRSLNAAFFDVSNGGDVIVYQHLFWVFGHPEVYVIILPVFGMISHTFQSENGGGNCLFNQLGMNYAIFSIFVVGF